MNMRNSFVFVGVSGLVAVGLGLGTKQSSSSQDVPKNVTYAEHVAPILNAHCTSCHHEGAVAPFTLVGYEASKKQSTNIAGATDGKRMPPWKAVHGYGEFKDENRLSETQLAILKAWSETGAKRGDAKKEPKPQVFSNDWDLGKPDLLLSASKPFKLEAEGEDVYRNFVFDLKNTEPLYVTAMDVKPGNRKVVHHVIGFLDAGGQSVKLADRNKDGQEGYTSGGGGIGTIPSGSLGGWAPGVTVRKTAPGTAFVVKPGTKIVMQVHYHKSGKDEVDHTKLGLYTTKEKPKKEVDIFWAANPMFKIPAGAGNHRVAWRETIPADSTIYTVMPHMHLLGKSMKAKLIKDDGTEVPLVFVDKWDFNWQLVYALKEPMLVKKGWKIAIEAFYDNSDTNPYKTNKDVRWGEQTTDEMALLVIGYTADKPIDLATQLKQKVLDLSKGGN
jgi:Copper type II ascorbate-dependent monooxygenase, C-terminal domain